MNLRPGKSSTLGVFMKENDVEERPISVSEETYKWFALLRARLSVRFGRKLTWDESVRVLLERERKKSEILSWLYAVGIFVAVTWVLLWPVYIFAPSLIPLMFVIGLVIATISAYLLTPLALRKYKPFVDAPKEIVESFERLSVKAGLRNLPVLTVSETGEANAMAYCSLFGGRVCITRGLIQAYKEGKFSLNELQAIIAHEVSHLKHMDSLKFGLVLSWVNVFEYLGNESIQVGATMAKLSEEGEGGLSVAMAVSAWFSTVIGSLLLLMAKIASALSFHLSRRQEFEADDLAAELTRPEEVASALEKIKALNAELVAKDLEKTPFADRWQIQPRNTTWVDSLWDTHPPLEKRVARQQALVAFL